MASTPVRVSSRLQKIEDRKNRQQALLFILLSIGFVLLVIFIGLPLFVKAAVFVGDLKSSSQNSANDALPPVAPKLSVAFEATNSATISIKGFAEPGTMITLKNNTNDKSAEMVTEQDGTFTFLNVDLTEGENNFEATAKNNANKESQPSTALSIIFDKQPPNLEISSPKEGAEFFEDNREIVVAGKTEVDTYVTVNGYVVRSDTEGNFVKRLLLITGDNEIKVIAKDTAGNETSKTVKVKYSN